MVTRKSNVRLSGRRVDGVALTVVVVLGLGLRLLWVFHVSADPGAIDRLPDQKEYLGLAENLAAHQGLWFADPRFEQHVYAYRTPGYPWFVQWFGSRMQVIGVAQSVLDVSTILAIYLMARRWLPPGPSLVASGLVAVDPNLVFFSATILSETLFTALLCWGMTLLIMSGGPWPARGRQLSMWLGGGVLLGLAALVRPGAIGLPVILGLAAALANRTEESAGKQSGPLPTAATMIAITAIILLPWAARNRQVVGAWIWTSTNEGITRYDGFNPDATGASDQRFINSMPWIRDMTEVARSQYFSDLAEDWIWQHPWLSVELAGIKIARTWSPAPLSVDFATRLNVIVGGGFAIVLFSLVLLAFWKKVLDRPKRGFLILPALYFTAAAALSVGSLRYRVPAEPPMTILAASAVGNVRRKLEPLADGN